jgi:hypothetical protein
MPGLFDGTDELARNVFRDHGLNATGQTLNSADHYKQFSKLAAPKNSERAVELVFDLMLKTYCYLNGKIDDETTRSSSRIGRRGELRQVTALSGPFHN